MALNFETKVLDLVGGPIDLSSDPDIAEAIAAAPRETGIRVFIQNVSSRSKLFFAEQVALPARMSRGHCLLVADGFVLRLRVGDPAGAWVWTTSSGQLAVSAVDD